MVRRNVMMFCVNVVVLYLSVDVCNKSNIYLHRVHLSHAMCAESASATTRDLA